MRITHVSRKVMGRLNISIPEDLAPLVSRWRRKINLSEICTRVLRHELAAVEAHRSAAPLLATLRRPNALERQLVERYGLAEAVVSDDEGGDARLIRESLGQTTADYMNQRLCNGAVLAIGGGRQTWCIVEHLGPRQLDIELVALGYRQNDPHVLNAHANTLTTLLWLLYSPRATARLVGGDPEEVLSPDLPVEKHLKYFVVGSCAPFSARSPLARLLGDEVTAMMLSRGATADFLYNFFDKRGQPITVPVPGDRSLLSARSLSLLSERPDTRVVLVAGGPEKVGVVRTTLEAKLCNVLVTETVTAEKLLHGRVRATNRSSRRLRART